MPDVTATLGAFNTIPITTAVTRLVTGTGQSRMVDILNIGAASIFMRADIDPGASDPYSLELPANFALNRVTVDGVVGLGVVGAAATTISVRAAT